MPRRGRSASPTPRAAPSMGVAGQHRYSSSAAQPARPASPPAIHRAPPTAPATATAAPQQPGLFAQMAATAGGVAIGSAVGHTVGSMLTGSGSAAAPAAVASSPQETYQRAHEDNLGTDGPCADEIRRFIECAGSQADLNLCQGFNEAVNDCKRRYNIH